MPRRRTAYKRPPAPPFQPRGASVPTCKDCGRKFDTEHGLKIHRARAHQ